MYSPGCGANSLRLLYNIKNGLFASPTEAVFILNLVWLDTTNFVVYALLESSYQYNIIAETARAFHKLSNLFSV